MSLKGGEMEYITGGWKDGIYHWSVERQNISLDDREMSISLGDGEMEYITRGSRDGIYH